jgi:RNA polymerase sigma-70 factor (ECF subfamily)
MFKILHNCCKNAQKIKYLHKNEVELSEVQNLSSVEKDHSENISLMNALKKLSAEERDIMILYYSEGYNSKEIGEILGLKDSTVRSKIKRATEKLREMLVI